MEYTHWLADYNIVTQWVFFLETCSQFENYFPPQPKNWHNRTTVLYTIYVRNPKHYFLPEPKN